MRAVVSLSQFEAVVFRTKGLAELTFEVDCDQMAMRLPLNTLAVFMIANSFW
jgi:hypothetical protein